MRIFRPCIVPVAAGLAFALLAACGSGRDDSPSVTPTPVPKPAAPSYSFEFVCIDRSLAPCKLMEKFISALDQRTDGQVVIKLSSYQDWRINGSDVIRLIGDGAITFGEVYSGFAVGEFPILDAANLWGLFPNPDTYFEAIDAISDDIERVIKKNTGGEVVAQSFHPSIFFFSEGPLTSLEGFQGMRTRNHSHVLSELVSDLGADPQVVNFDQVYPALETGQLDGAATCASCGFEAGWHEVSSHLTGPIPGSITQTFLTFNGETWRSLPPNFQEIILEEGAAHTARNRAQVAAWDRAGVEVLVMVGMEYADFSPEMVENLRTASETSVLPAWVKRTGGPESEAARLFNSKIAPIVGVRINSDGSISAE